MQVRLPIQICLHTYPLQFHFSMKLTTSSSYL